jgi:hypothetical protein
MDASATFNNISVISWLSQFSCLTFRDTGPQGLCFSNFTLLIGDIVADNCIVGGIWIINETIDLLQVTEKFITGYCH